MYAMRPFVIISSVTLKSLGPCPPCPKTVRVRCHCGRAGPALKRCSQKDWSCNEVCNKRLACQRHSCQNYCHKGKECILSICFIYYFSRNVSGVVIGLIVFPFLGECPPCPEKSDRLCMCGKNTSLRDCADPVWSCDEVCLRHLFDILLSLKPLWTVK